MKKNIILLILICLLSAAFLHSDNIQISQIDNSKLLTSQNIVLYLSATDANGNPLKNLKKEMFTVKESANGKDYLECAIVDFAGKKDYKDGINFLLLVDNSGSMYDDMKGNTTNADDARRITGAKKAIISFLQSVNNPKDTVGLVSYNAYYKNHSLITDNKTGIESLLSDITKPSGEEGWTEIYSSLYLAVDEFDKVEGRKVIIILSDGENMPYFVHTKKPHRDFGDKVFLYTEPILECQKEGVSVFAINFGALKDKKLSAIAKETGGSVYDANDPEELNNIYLKIVNQVQNEYVLTYKASMEPADKKFVKVDFKKDNKVANSVRFYFSSTIFGMPGFYSLLLLLVFLLALLLLWLLSLVKFKNKTEHASLEIISTQYGSPMTKAINLNEGQTIIGGSPDANMTIINSPTMKDKHAKIEYSKKDDTYTIVAGGDLKVNNKKVSTKVLEDGDVITAGGATIVFDEGMMDKKKKKK